MEPLALSRDEERATLITSLHLKLTQKQLSVGRSGLILGKIFSFENPSLYSDTPPEMSESGLPVELFEITLSEMLIFCKPCKAYYSVYVPVMKNKPGDL